MPTARALWRGPRPRWRQPLPLLGALMAAVLLAAAVVPTTIAAGPQRDGRAHHRVEAVVAAARAYLDYPYRIGTEGPVTFDCSGLVFRAFADAGVLSLIGGTRVRAASYKRWFAARGRVVAAEEEAVRGDLVIYGNGSHIGIYLGEGRALSAVVSGVAVHSLHGLSFDVTGFLKVDWTGKGGNGPGAPPLAPTAADAPELPAVLVPPLAWAPVIDAEAVALAAAPEGVERPDMRTANSRTYEDVKGRFTTEFFAHPINYQPRDSTAWHPIDLRLRPVRRGTTILHTVASPVSVSVAAPDAAGAFVELNAGEQSVVIAMPDARSRRGHRPQPRVGDDGLYADYFGFLRDGTGLRVLPRADGLKLVLVLAKQPRSRTFTFDLDAAGLALTAEPDGTISLRDAEAAVVGRIARPLLLDSSDVDGNGGGTYSSAAALGLSGQPDDLAVTVSVERRFLEEAVYPAYLDLSIVEFPSPVMASDATFASGEHPDGTFGAYQRPESSAHSELWTGRRPGSQLDSEAYLGFDGLREALGEVDVESAVFAVYPYWQYDGEAAQPSWVRRVAEPWNAGTLTWNLRPVTDLHLGPLERNDGGWSEIDLTDHVHAILSGEVADYGLMLHATGAGRDGWKRIVARTQPLMASLEPRLVVNWTAAPAQAAPDPELDATPRTGPTVSD